MTDPIAPVTAQVTPAPEAPQSQAVVPQASSDAPVVTTPAADPTTAAPVSPEGESTTKKNSAQERIQDLVAERNAAKEYAEFWRSKALEVIRTPSEQPQIQQPQIQDTAPTLEQFNYDQGKWSKALGEWNKAISRQEARQEYTELQARQTQSDLVQQYESRVETFRKDHSDFDIVTSNPKLPSLDRLAASMVINSDEGAAITYHLAKNPEEAVRIARLPPSQQALAIGRLENQVKAPKVTPAVQPTPAMTQPKTAAVPDLEVTKAPDPPTPVPAGGAAEVTMENSDVNTWMKLRTGELRKRRRGSRVA